MPDINPQDTVAALVWVTGPLDHEWHPVAPHRFGLLHCACGRYVHGPVHLRRYRPATGENGRALCPASPPGGRTDPSSPANVEAA